MLTQAANGTDSNNPFNAQAFKRPDIGTHGNFCCHNTMTATMTRQECHRHTLYFTNRYDITRVAKWCLNCDLFHIRHTFHPIETASADNPNSRSWHTCLLQTKFGRKTMRPLYLCFYSDILQFTNFENCTVSDRNSPIKAINTLSFTGFAISIVRNTTLLYQTTCLTFTGNHPGINHKTDYIRRLTQVVVRYIRWQLALRKLAFKRLFCFLRFHLATEGRNNLTRHAQLNITRIQ